MPCSPLPCRHLTCCAFLPPPCLPHPLQTDIEARPLLFNSFMARDANEAPVYACAPSAEALKKAVEEKLAEYNDGNAGGWGEGDAWMGWESRRVGGLAADELTGAATAVATLNSIQPSRRALYTPCS